MSISNYLETKLLDHVLNNDPYTAPGTVNLALFTNVNGNTAENLENNSTQDEVQAQSGESNPYTRIAAIFSTATTQNGETQIVNQFQQQWFDASSEWGTITHFAIIDFSNNVLFWGELDEPTQVKIGRRITFEPGQLRVTFD